MTKRSLAFVAFLSAAVGVSASAATVGEIYVCYACQNTGNAAIDSYLASGAGGPAVASDGILFEFVNTSGSAITGSKFSVTGAVNDSFSLPTLAANSDFILVPGITSDGGSHPSGGLFQVTGSVMDTSDGNGNVNDSSIFAFTGLSAGLAVSSGNITPGEPSLILPFRDNPANGSTSFVGDGPSGDGGCNNCYYGPIGALTVPSGVSGAPEPSAYGLAMAGLGGLAILLRRRSVR